MVCYSSTYQGVVKLIFINRKLDSEMHVSVLDSEFDATLKLVGMTDKMFFFNKTMIPNTLQNLPNNTLKKKK